MAKSVKASPVTADKLPMSPPAGTRFDPPIEVTLPNASSQPVGDNLPIVQWDHDLGQYVAMGRATVSEDGSVLVCDSGSGISKAGWGGGAPPPPPPKCEKTPPPPVCNDCQRLESGTGDCPTGNCVALPNLPKVNSGKCCGGSIIDTDKFCCLQLPTTFMSSSFEKGKPITKSGNFNAEFYPNKQQFEGPPAGPKDDPQFNTTIGSITHNIDGCSTPEALAGIMFSPGLFIHKATGENTPPNPMAEGFYQACSTHDKCYQTCGNVQSTCDTTLKNDLESFCRSSFTDAIPGSGFQGGLHNAINGQYSECMLNAYQMYTALQGVGFLAHGDRQKQMCVACPK